MTRRRGCRRWIVISLSAISVVACVALGVSAVFYYRFQQARVQNEPPSVTITDPAEGASTLAGSNMVVSAMAFGDIPITRAELWVDGELVDTEETRIEGGTSPFYVSFDLLVSQGLHTLFVRAVNTSGLIGDSWPVGIGGVERPGPDEPARAVTVAEGQTLEDIATAYDANPETVRQLNPGLGDQQPSPGSTVYLPPPRYKAEPSPGETSAEDRVGPTFPSEGATETGPLLSPSGPPLAVSEAFRLLPNLLDIITALNTPAAPTNLEAEVIDCMVRLRWNDNADNEERYEVWYLWNITQAPQLIANLEPGKGGQVWYEFPAPSAGAFIFWVEAANSLGRQPSNKVGAVVGLDCGQTLAQELQVEALDMTVPSGYSQVYCYVSFEGEPHVRVPVDTKDFIQVTGGQGNIAAWASGNKKLVVPIPGDGSLELEGYCYGRSDGKSSQFGTFGGKYPRETWDGVRRPLAGTGFEIGVAIKPLGGALDTSGLLTTYAYEDPTIPEPYDVFEDVPRSWLPVERGTRSLSWKWDNPNNVTITGFQIFLNGSPYSPGGGWALVDPMNRSAEVKLPRECGGHITWRVRAVAGQAVSQLSSLKTPDNDYDLPSCPEPVYAMVKFNNITFIKDCDSLDLYWFFRLNGVTKQFGNTCDPDLLFPWPYCTGGTHHIDDDCGPHSPASLCSGLTGCNDPNLDTVVADLGQTAIGGGGGPISIEVVDGFWDTYILVGGDDNIGVHRALYEFPSLQDAQLRLGCGREVCVGPSTGDPYATEYRGYHATICYTLYIFPQAEGLNCPVSEPAYIP